MKDIADVVSRDTVCYVVQGGSNFWLCGLKCVHSNEGYWAIFATQPIVLEIKVVLTFKCVDEILEQKLLGSTLLGAVYYATIGRFHDWVRG